MAWEFQSDRPIYSQLIDKIELRIISGFYPPDSKLPSVRELAAEAAVNPNTMQKALAELEQRELIYSQRTNGRFITSDTQLIQQKREQVASDEVGKLFGTMHRLGYNSVQTISFVEQYAKRECVE